MNKKSNIMSIIYMFVVLFVVLLLGLGIVFGTLIIDWVFDEAVPEISNLGQVGNANLTEIAGYTITPLNSIVQSFTWLGALLYIFGLVACFGFAFAFRFTGNKWLLGFFIACMFMFIIVSIFVSNIYQDYYTGTDDVALRLQSNQIMSFLLLYSPMIMCIIGFICGVIMFTGEEQEVLI